MNNNSYVTSEQLKAYAHKQLYNTTKSAMNLAGTELESSYVKHAALWATILTGLNSK